MSADFIYSLNFLLDPLFRLYLSFQILKSYSQYCKNNELKNFLGTFPPISYFVLTLYSCLYILSIKYKKDSFLCLFVYIQVYTNTNYFIFKLLHQLLYFYHSLSVHIFEYHLFAFPSFESFLLIYEDSCFIPNQKYFFMTSIIRAKNSGKRNCKMLFMIKLINQIKSYTHTI